MAKCKAITGSAVKGLNCNFLNEFHKFHDLDELSIYLVFWRLNATRVRVTRLTRSGVMVFSVNAGTSITSFLSKLVIMGGLS